MVMYPDITPEELAARLGSADAPFLLDVREPSECAAGMIPGAVNIPMGELAARGREVPRDREIVVICRSGNRSGMVCLALARAGLPVSNLAGGMIAWQRHVGGPPVAATRAVEASTCCR
jgi:rhodanese-related sulfurtransferase